MDVSETITIQPTTLTTYPRGMSSGFLARPPPPPPPTALPPPPPSPPTLLRQTASTTSPTPPPTPPIAERPTKKARSSFRPSRLRLRADCPACDCGRVVEVEAENKRRKEAGSTQKQMRGHATSCTPVCEQYVWLQAKKNIIDAENA
jgi:hypothetical protein